MDLDTLLKAMTPDIYRRISTAVELGKWPDGTVLTEAQRDSALQAVMLYQSRHNAQAEHMSVEVGGEIKFKSKAEFKRDFEGDQSLNHTDEIARFDYEQL
ncbi:YeaC family protein [Photobacterium minamisatsumaniensis]|uniref:YeaC family protein n=1 Tax=Photobacterium minamisatsumaniensis TaxID=2910233 RepID=UPI003D0EAF8A